MNFNAFRKHTICMCILGVRPPGGVRWKWLGVLLDIYLIVQLSCIAVWGYLFFQGAFLYLPDAFMDRIVGVSAAVSVLGSIAKLITFRRKGHVLKDLFEELGGFSVNTKRGRLVAKVTTIYEVSVAAIVVTHNMHIAIDPVLHRSSPYWTASQTSGTKMEIIRDYIFNLDSAIVALSANVIGDTLFLTLTNQICHRLLLLAETVSSIGKGIRPVEGLHVQEGATDREVIRKCVEEHNLLLKMTKQVQELYDRIFLVQLIYSFSDASLTLFTISQYDDFMEAMNELLPQFISLFLELFLFCWGGQMINNHFEKLHLASYDSEWYSLDKKDQSSILIIQTFTQRPVDITSTSIFHMNFHAYETICKEVFSYYTIMRQLFSQK
nr:odorant receptor 69 [Graphosoma rubrolineatum]